MQNLLDKVIIITGGGSGIGRAAALEMARQGAKLAIAGRTASKLDKVKAEVETLGSEAITFPLDVADHEAVHKMAQAVLAHYGKIDVLVNNAGHTSNFRRLQTSSPEEIRAVIDTNLVGTMFCSQAVIGAMLNAKSGIIINVSSLSSKFPSPFSGVAYGPAKAAVNAFTEYLNTEFKNTGVRACAIIPGEVDTPILDGRYIPPSPEARATMVGVEETTAAICLVASLPPRTNIPELTIRPTFHRDFQREIEPMPEG